MWEGRPRKRRGPGWLGQSESAPRERGGREGRQAGGDRRRSCPCEWEFYPESNEQSLQDDKLGEIGFCLQLMRSFWPLCSEWIHKLGEGQRETIREIKVTEGDGDGEQWVAWVGGTEKTRTEGTSYAMGLCT